MYRCLISWYPLINDEDSTVHLPTFSASFTRMPDVHQALVKVRSQSILIVPHAVHQALVNVSLFSWTKGAGGGHTTHLDQTKPQLENAS